MTQTNRTQSNHSQSPLEARTGDRYQPHEDRLIQQALTLLLDAGITFEVLAFDQAA